MASVRGRKRRRRFASALAHPFPTFSYGLRLREQPDGVEVTHVAAGTDAFLHLDLCDRVQHINGAEVGADMSAVNAAVDKL